MRFQFSRNPILRWTPALLLLLAIFLFSARPSTEIEYSLLRHIAFKSGHVIGYALLSLSFWRGLEFNGNKRWLAWFLALLYAVTDEYHQAFVPGRHPAAFDVLVYDNLGALASLWLVGRFMKQKQPVNEELVAIQETRTANG